MSGGQARLSDVGVGESVTVVRLDNARTVALRLLELGLLPGTVVTVVRRAPMGDPIELRLRDYALSIRDQEARQIHVVRAEAAR